MSKIYLTTPIYYINDIPHIGHAYTTIAADVLARYYRGRGEDVLFATGTDENGQKTIEAAKASHEPIQEYTDRLALEWRKIWDTFGISYDRFVRTTEPAHIKAVQAVLARINAAGDIYKGVYEGLYCVGHEAFIQESDLAEGKCPDHGKEPERVKESNYFFRLSKYTQPLLDHIEAHPEFVQPGFRRNEVVSFIKGGLDDISVSRVSQKWGIPFPGDDSQAVYVWFDALINYLTSTGYPEDSYTKWWPADFHLVGKDIIRFHCVIWPAMLMSAGIQLPKTIFAHGFITLEGVKISKSLGNAVDPVKLAEKYGNDTLRYYLLRDIPFGQDGHFSYERLEAVYNSELANNLGNLVQRVSSMIVRYFDGAIPASDSVPADQLDQMDWADYQAAIEALKFDQALAIVQGHLDALNRYIERTKPWEQAKTSPDSLQASLAMLAVAIVDIGGRLQPFLPETSAKILDTFKDGQINQSVGILFPRIEPDKA